MEVLWFILLVYGVLKGESNDAKSFISRNSNAVIPYHRQPRNWVSRFSTPEALRGKLLQRQLHLIHGQDVARALVLGVHGQFAKTKGQRWIVTDGGCYDWVKLILAWGSQEQVETTQKLIPSVLGTSNNTTTIYDLVDPNNGVIIHPRLDSTEFWDTFGLKPTQFLQVP